MPKKTVIKDNVFARGVAHIADDINAIRDRHKIEPADLVRGLLEAATDFYRENGFFSFPVRIVPEAFQAQYVAEQQAKYQADALASNQRELRATITSTLKSELRKKDKRERGSLQKPPPTPQ